jgi:hypothetical protein
VGAEPILRRVAVHLGGVDHDASPAAPARRVRVSCADAYLSEAAVGSFGRCLPRTDLTGNVCALPSRLPGTQLRHEFDEGGTQWIDDKGCVRAGRP